MSFGTDEADTPKAFAIAMDHVPTKAMPRSCVKVLDGGESRLCVVNEVHDASHAWTQTQVWFISTQDDISMEMLIV